MGARFQSFHHELLQLAGYGGVEWRDHSSWLHGIGKPCDYYLYCFAHAMVHLVWFETFAEPDESESESRFSKQVALPAFEATRASFGLDPLIVRLYPKRQSDEEDLHWWLYPGPVNSRLIELARAHKLPVFPYERHR
jgi:hypothetical protein